MKHFAHVDASSLDEAAKLAGPDAEVIAGGTDLLGTLKDEILRTYPKTVVNLKTIPDLDYITEDGDTVRIGALTKVKTVAESELVQTKFACLAQAASKVASPAIRAMGTIGGNICQRHRCWYFRSADDRFDCFRKGGDYCPALAGDARYHSIFGPEEGCYAANSPETAPALIALGATIVTTKREIPAGEFFHANVTRSTVLEDGELVREIAIPNKQFQSAFTKYALRKSIDFAIANCAVAKDPDGGWAIVMGGVYPSPVRATEAEAMVSGAIDEKTAQAAADAAVASAQPLECNTYKVEIARAMVKRALLALA